MQKLPKLIPGDSVEIIAPASRCSDHELFQLRELLTSWQLNCIVDENIFGDDILCANTDNHRFNSLRKALFRPETKAIICARGGYGSMRLIPALSEIKPPDSPKLLVGMSDITALNLFLQQKWGWPTLHGALTKGKYSAESIKSVKDILFGEVDHIEFIGIPMNNMATKNATINTSITGGNLCLTQASIGTLWQIDAHDKIVLLEEVGERGYRIDRMLEHLGQANVLQHAAAIVFSDFIDGNEPDGSCKIRAVLERFALNFTAPVVLIKGVGHAHTNLPLPLGTSAELLLGDKVKLICYR